MSLERSRRDALNNGSATEKQSQSPLVTRARSILPGHMGDDTETGALLVRARELSASVAEADAASEQMLPGGSAAAAVLQSKGAHTAEVVRRQDTETLISRAKKLSTVFGTAKLASWQRGRGKSSKAAKTHSTTLDTEMSSSPMLTKRVEDVQHSGTDILLARAKELSSLVAQRGGEEPPARLSFNW